HPAHIHANNAATTGGIVLDLKNVIGGTGKSATSVIALKDGTAITYDGLLTYNGYLNVHLSSVALGTLISQGNIGSNAP
ncbi:MAG: CHRD domain-containing protein, partial [Cyclobacteriaceae bacterium]